MKCQYIHGGHGQTSTIYEAADVTVQFDEVQVRLLCLNLRRFFLGYVSEAEDILLAELSIIVEAELRIHAKDIRKLI